MKTIGTITDLEKERFAHLATRRLLLEARREQLQLRAKLLNDEEMELKRAEGKAIKDLSSRIGVQFTSAKIDEFGNVSVPDEAFEG